MPSSKGALLKMTVARTEHNATVTTRSKAFSFVGVRLPEARHDDNCRIGNGPYDEDPDDTRPIVKQHCHLLLRRKLIGVRTADELLVSISHPFAE